jgi:hypothetical protein
VAPAASFAYGPGGGSPTPPGFGTTDGACSAGPDACSVHSTQSHCKLKVSVPAGAFDVKTDVIISDITKDAADKHLNTNNIHTVCAFGVAFVRNGNLVHIKKHHPSAKLIFTGLPIKSTDSLRILIPGGGSKAKNATFSNSHAESTLRATQELAIVSS